VVHGIVGEVAAQFVDIRPPPGRTGSNRIVRSHFLRVAGGGEGGRVGDLLGDDTRHDGDAVHAWSDIAIRRKRIAQGKEAGVRPLDASSTSFPVTTSLNVWFAWKHTQNAFGLPTVLPGLSLDPPIGDPGRAFNDVIGAGASRSTTR
jgi:hypothetical protein